MIANKTITINGKPVDASHLTPDFLANTLHSANGIDANVATGYHAIEFLLWGQDLNGTGPGAGNRPYTDYDLKNCTHGNCDRRPNICARPRRCWSPTSTISSRLSNRTARRPRC